LIVIDYSILGTGVEGGTGGSISGAVGEGSSMGAGFGSGFWLSMFSSLNIVYEIYVPALFCGCYLASRNFKNSLDA
jgi:hypothetical protein